MADQRVITDDAIAMMLGEVARVEAIRRYVNAAPRLAVEAATAKRPESRPVANTFARALHWLCTMARLDRPLDFQASTAGARAMMEMMIDLSLITGSPDDHPLEKLVAWEKSALLKHADAVAELDNSNDPELAPILDQWRTKHRDSVQAGRETYWPATGKDAGKPAKHPRNRWTGRDLASDARLANDVAGSVGILAIYERLHTMFCWVTHGSGAVGILGAADFPGHNAAGLHYGAQMGVNVARLALVHFDLYDADAEAANRAAIVEADQAFEDRVREYEVSQC